MRTCHGIEQTDAYVAARELPLMRCGARAEANGLAVSFPLAEALLDSRHFSSDRRLGYWTPAQAIRDCPFVSRRKAPEPVLGVPSRLRTVRNVPARRPRGGNGAVADGGRGRGCRTR